jgi:hypothetical protein
VSFSKLLATTVHPKQLLVWYKKGASYKLIAACSLVNDGWLGLAHLGLTEAVVAGVA